jgi:hypothetical protein
MIPTVHAPQAFEQALDIITDYINEAGANGVIFNANETIRVIWMWFKLYENDGVLELHAPDFKSFPIVWSKDCSKALNTVLIQKYVYESFFDEMSECHLSQSALSLKGINQDSQLFMNRIDDQEANDSGWYFGDESSKLDANDPDNLEYRSLYEMVLMCPQSIDFMLMPKNTQVILNKDSPAVLRDYSEVRAKENSYWKAKFT